MRGALVVACLLGCGSSEPAVALRFTPDPGVAGSEAYVCFGFDASLLDGADIAGIALAPAEGPVVLHHVALYATPDTFADGPVDCLTMPANATSLNVWATGGGDLDLPADLALAVPDGTVRLIVQAHVLRLDDGPAPPRTLTLTRRSGAPHRAGWLPLRAPTPAISPHSQAQSTATCSIADELHVISTWPHMHQIGSEFHGTVVHPDSIDSLIDVVPYQFDAQRAYPVDVLVSPGDAIGTECIWQNPTDTTVLPGPQIDQEMCGQSLIAWPVEAAHCS